jgi:hypothetical protein
VDVKTEVSATLAVVLTTWTGTDTVDVSTGAGVGVVVSEHSSSVLVDVDERTTTDGFVEVGVTLAPMEVVDGAVEDLTGVVDAAAADDVADPLG